jgi:hypothetical protein
MTAKRKKMKPVNANAPKAAPTEIICLAEPRDRPLPLPSDDECDFWDAQREEERFRTEHRDPSGKDDYLMEQGPPDDLP